MRTITEVLTDCRLYGGASTYPLSTLQQSGLGHWGWKLPLAAPGLDMIEWEV